MESGATLLATILERLHRLARGKPSQPSKSNDARPTDEGARLTRPHVRVSVSRGGNDTGSSAVVLPLDDCDLEGWHPAVRGWSLGGPGSGAAIELDRDPFNGARIGIVLASNHVLLWSRDALKGTIPHVAIELGDAWHAPSRPLRSGEAAEIRFDSHRLKIDEFVLQVERPT